MKDVINKGIMMHGMKKKIIAAVVIFAVVYLSLVGVFLVKQKTTNLVKCSLYSKVFYIPSIACRAYLFDVRNKNSDIEQLKSRGGVKLIFAAASQLEAGNKMEGAYSAIDKNVKVLLRHFLHEGLDINQIGRDDGMTTLHRVTMMNQPLWVQYLLDNGADLTVRSKEHHLTALEIAILLQQDNPKIDRTKVIEILKAHTKFTK